MCPPPPSSFNTSEKANAGDGVKQERIRDGQLFIELGNIDEAVDGVDNTIAHRNIGVINLHLVNKYLIRWVHEHSSRLQIGKGQGGPLPRSQICRCFYPRLCGPIR
jgi:hypothetical protein